MQNRKKSIAIIGAGISGLTAAKELNKNHIVTVFEKSRGPGGRSSTRREDQLRFDHGAQYFTVKNERFHLQVRKWLGQNIVQVWDGKIYRIENNNPQPTSSKISRYVGVPGMNALSKALATDLDIKFTTRILSAHKIKNEWKLQSEDQREFGPFDVLVLSIPPLQAVPFLETSPELREKIKAIKLEPCWALMSAFDSRLPIHYDGAFVNDSALGWIARNSSKPDRPPTESWILHGSKEWSGKYLEKPASWVSEVLMKEFFDINNLAPVEPVLQKAHRWRYSIAANPESVGFLWSADQKIGVIGDWLMQSRIEGAYLSGLTFAEHLMHK